MQNYGKQIKWSTVGAPNPAGGFCENYSYQERHAQDDHEDDSGDHGVTVLHDNTGAIAFASKLTSDAVIPVISDTGGCLIEITGLSTGAVLLSQVVESWGIKAPRRLSCSAAHFPDLTAGGSSTAATLEAVPAITTPPIMLPAGKIAWGTKDIESALGIIQAFTITQTVRLSPYSEEGKIVAVIASLYQMTYNLQVLALSAATRPANGQALALATAPARFKTTNFIVDGTERFRGSDGVIFDINARWAPSLDA
jgi:hypothetical protein